MHIPSWAPKVARDSIFTGAAIAGMEQMFLKKLDNISPPTVYEYIRDNRPLVIGEGDLPWARKLYQKFKPELQVYTADHLLEKIHNNHPEIWAIIINTPGGAEWLSSQLDGIRGQLDESS